MTSFIKATTGTIRSRTARSRRPISFWSSTATCRGFRRSASPREDAAVFIIDVDPLKQSTPLWYIKARRSYRADAATALAQLNACIDRVEIDAQAAERRRHYAERHRERRSDLARLEASSGEIITPEYLTACVRRQVGLDAIVVNEGITNYPTICDHMAREKPGTMFTSGGSSLGWSGGAAIGMKLAAPEETLVVLTGDGSYMFSAPSTVHWMARRYKTPFLQIIYNNRGWKAPKFSTLAIHPAGFASRAEDLDTSFDPPADVVHWSSLLGSKRLCATCGRGSRKAHLWTSD